MKIDYSSSTFKLFAGDGGEITDYVDSIKVGVPDPDPGQILTWQGQVTISRNLKAIRAGLDDSWFNPVSFPLRWRPDRPFRLELYKDGQIATIPLRVQKYTYNKLTSLGTANLVQVLDCVAKDRPADSPEFKVDRKGGVELSVVIKSLIGMAYDSISLPMPTISLPSIWGKFEDSIATRNPINDASDMAAACWQFMRVLEGESIEFASLDPTTYPVLFRRPFGSIEIEPDMNSQVDWKSKVIVTGHYQRAEVPICVARTEGATFVDKEGLDQKNRPAFMTTRSDVLYNYTLNDLTGRTPSGSSTSVTEQKTIITEYADSTSGFTLRSLWIQLSDGLSTSLDGDPIRTLNPGVVLSEIPTFPTKKCATEVVGTLTVVSKPMGLILKDVIGLVGRFGADLYVESVEFQSERKKVTWKCRGIFDDGTTGTLLELVVANKEVVSEKSASRQSVVETGTTCLEEQKCPEPRQEMPDFKMETVAVRSECAIAPQGWEPLVKLPLVQDMGFVPSQAHGDMLACQVAARHVRRGNNYICEMPIPVEWLAAKCPPTFRFHYDDAEFQAVAVAIEIAVANNITTRKLTCDALRLGSAPTVPSPSPQQPYLPIGFQIIGIDSIVGFSGDTFPSWQLNTIGAV